MSSRQASISLSYSTIYRLDSTERLSSFPLKQVRKTASSPNNRKTKMHYNTVIIYLVTLTSSVSALPTGDNEARDTCLGSIGVSISQSISYELCAVFPLSKSSIHPTDSTHTSVHSWNSILLLQRATHKPAHTLH
jgi:hypothetical protein